MHYCMSEMQYCLKYYDRGYRTAGRCRTPLQHVYNMVFAPIHSEKRYETMTGAAQNIKSMKLYTHVERVYNELDELGKNRRAPLSVAELSAFDQLHYHGTDAVDCAIRMMGINPRTSVLEIGSGIGGCARHIAHKTGARVTALELQPDQDKVASELSARCSLTENLRHVCGDFLTYEWGEQKFDAIVSWLALYHIPQRRALLLRCHSLLNPGGGFYAEDLFARRPFSQDEHGELASGLFASHLPTLNQYQEEVTDAGFELEEVDDMSDDWTAFTHQRLDDYRAARERHVRVHGEATVNALDDFYSLVCRHFKSGKLGGIRLFARKA